MGLKPPGGVLTLRSLEPPFCPSRVLMGPDNRAIDVGHIPVDLADCLGLRLDGGKHALPEAGPLPPGEATGPGAPGAIALGQVSPGGSRAQHPQDAVQDAAMVHSRPSSLGFLGWEQRLPPLSLGIGYIPSVYAT